MIFKKFFTPKWQHKDAQVRLVALADLEPQKKGDLDTLTTMAFNDAEAGIRRKALDKINQLSVWQQAAETERDEKLKRTCLEKLKRAVLGKEDFAVSEQEKDKIINGSLKLEQLEDIFKLTDDASLKLKLIFKIDKKRLYEDTIYSTTDEALAELCYQNLDLEANPKALSKLIQKAKCQSIVDKVQAILTAEQEKQQLIANTQKQSKLVLSRWLALKDKNDYLVIKAQLEQLQQEWQVIESNLSVIEEDEANTIKQKQVEISAKVEKSVAVLAQAYQEQQAKVKEAEIRADVLNQAKNAVSELSQLLSEAVSTSADENHQAIINAVVEARTALSTAHISGQDVEKIHAELNHIEHQANHLPEFAEQVSAITRLVAQLSQQQPPESIEDLDEKQQVFNEWRREWKQATNALPLPLPASLKGSGEELIQLWKTAIKSVSEGQEKLVRQIRAKIREAKKLITQGKYNALFGLFNKISAWHDQLNEGFTAQVERDFSQLQQEIDNLADWKAYIATPRKREMLEEMLALADTPLDSPTDQAAKVKLSRKVWFMLGKVDTDEDRQMNIAFDEACEKAFAPCRLYYQEQEQIRKTNLVEKESLIKAIEELAASEHEQDLTKIGGEVNKIFNQWKQVGNVDRESYKSVNQRFFNTYRQLKDKVSEFYRDNESKKQKLIESALSCVELEDKFEATNQLKALQSEWKTIAFAGPGKENKLWKRFREINDQVFSQKAEVQAQHKADKDQQFDSLSTELTEIESLLETAGGHSQLKEIKEKLNNCRSQLDTLSDNQKKKLQSKIEHMTAQIETKTQGLITEKQLAKYKALFGFITQQVADDAAELPSLPTKWQSILANSDQEADYQLRKRETIKLEIVANASSPDADKQLRMEIQVAMLEDKLKAGNSSNTESIILDWLKLGRFNAEQLDLVKRAESAIIDS